MSTVTSKGQVTLPKKVRDALGLEPGSQVEFEVAQGMAILRKRIAPETANRWRGFLRGKVDATTTDELMEELRGE